MLKRKRLLGIGGSLVGASGALLLGGFLLTHQAGAAQTPSEAPYFTDQAWNTYSYSSSHNAVVPLSNTAPAVLGKGVQWQTQEFDAVPLARQPLGTTAFGGAVNAAVTMTQNLGNGVGVTAWGRDIYASSSAGYVYAVSALDGRIQWKDRTLNVDMSNPLVANNTVYIGTGNVAFNFPALLTFSRSMPTMRGGGYGGIYALDAQTGRVKWFYPLPGEQMPTPALSNGTLYFANGDGTFYALSASTGKLDWSLHLGGFDSMSSTTLWTDPSSGISYAILGTTDPNVLNGINLSTHQLAWTLAVPGITLTGMGDSTPAYSATAGVLIDAESFRLETTVAGVQTSDFAVIGIDPATGKIIWQEALGRGPVPAAYRGAVPTTHDGIVYVSDTATSRLFALDAKTGTPIWNTAIPNAMAAGAGRGAPTYADGVVWMATSENINAFDPKTGTVLASYHVGGRFGIVNPVIAGGTMYLDDSYDWIMAVPLHSILPNLAS